MKSNLDLTWAVIAGTSVLVIFAVAYVWMIIIFNKRVQELMRENAALKKELNEKNQQLKDLL